MNIKPPALFRHHLLVLLAGLLVLLPALAGELTPGRWQLAFLRPAAGQGPAVDAEAETPAAAENTPLARRAIDASPLLDPNNPDYGRLQSIGEATRHMPYDANRFPDWMKAINEGQIKPRAGLTGKETMEVLDLDIVMRNTKEMPFVRFPHRSHTLWLACSNCHPAPFKAQAGSTSIRMADIFRGQFCGMCHDRVAFITFFSCQRCHSVPQNSVLPAKAGDRR
jgi:c(7)-type cytochrome triheme protein